MFQYSQRPGLQKSAIVAWLVWWAVLSLGLAGAAEPAAEKYAPMPWHLVDNWWDIGESRPFQSLAVDVTITGDVPPDINLYIAPIGLAHLSDTPFYGGLQTQSDGYTKANTALRKIGPGLIFSCWGERSLDAIRPADGGLCQSSGHEGDFISVRRPHAWTPGKYTYRLVRMDEEQIGDKAFTWVGGFVYSHDRDEHIFIGAMRFPGTNLVLDRKVANFVEIYGQQRPVADIPKIEVTFGPPVVNGVTTSPVSGESIYPEGVPDYAQAKAVDGIIVITLGVPVKGRTVRSVRLIGDSQ